VGKSARTRGYGLFCADSLYFWAICFAALALTERLWAPASRWGYRGLLHVVVIVGLATGMLCIAKRLRPQAAISRRLVIPFLAALAISLGLSLWWSIAHWGYWFAPPRLDQRVTSASKVDAIGTFSLFKGKKTDALLWKDLTVGERTHPTEYPIDYTINKWKQAGLPARIFGKRRVTDAELAKMSLDPKVRVKSDKGYHSQLCFNGYWAELTGRDKAEYLFVAANGGSVSNDHFPHYRLLYRRDGGRLNLVSHQVFYYDVAGLELVSWDKVFVLLAFFGAWAVIFGKMVSLPHREEPVVEQALS
jgi:hypothetical protein